MCKFSRGLIRVAGNYLRHSALCMRKRLIAMMIADTCEMLFALSVIGYWVIYASSYYVGGVNKRLVTAMSIILIAASLAYIASTIVAMAKTREDSYYKNTHKFLHYLRPKKDSYAKYKHRLLFMRYRVWNRFVLGVNWKRILKAFMFLSGAVATACIGVLAIRDSWMYAGTILSGMVILTITFLGCAYVKLKNSCRSSNGLIQYLIQYSTSLSAVNQQFKQAEKITKNLYISYDILFMRDPRNVQIVNLADVKDYRVYRDCITVYSARTQLLTDLCFKNDDEYQAIYKALLRRPINRTYD